MPTELVAIAANAANAWAGQTLTLDSHRSSAEDAYVTLTR
jgi:hypothetical protein